MEIESCHAFRVIRNADLTLAEEEADDSWKPSKWSCAGGVSGGPFAFKLTTFSSEVRELLMRELDLRLEDVYEVDGLLDYGGLWAMHELDRPELKDEPFRR